jgi:hypothetical protein
MLLESRKFRSTFKNQLGFVTATHRIIDDAQAVLRVVGVVYRGLRVVTIF